ncbi:MAG: hypothetical protein IT283_07945 [Bacteroidetes bacterium]|nr:hypothetical protein [Bacteroidota bacterium]
MRSPKPEARSPKPEARSPKPEARSPKPEARSPKPEAYILYMDLSAVFCRLPTPHKRPLASKKRKINT